MYCASASPDILNAYLTLRSTKVLSVVRGFALDRTDLLFSTDAESLPFDNNVALLQCLTNCCLSVIFQTY